MGKLRVAKTAISLFNWAFEIPLNPFQIGKDKARYGLKSVLKVHPSLVNNYRLGTAIVFGIVLGLLTAFITFTPYNGM